MATVVHRYIGRGDKVPKPTPEEAKRAMIYARFDERFSRPTLALESASGRLPFPANERPDNSFSGMIYGAHKIFEFAVTKPPHAD